MAISTRYKNTGRGRNDQFKTFELEVDHYLQGHPPELSDSVKLLLSDAKRHGFEIDQVLKSID